jgi:hypothetical protein
MDYITARGFERAGKATIVADAVAEEKPAPVAVEAPKPAAKKGR